MRGAILLFVVASVVPARGIDGLERAQNLYNHTDYSAAISVLKQEPIADDPHALELLGRCYFMQTDYRKASEIFEKAVALNPENSMALTWLGRAYGRRAETAFPLSAVGFAGKARQSLEKAVQLDPHNSEAIDDLFEFYLQAPGFIGGGIDKARGLLPTIERNSPAEVHFASARIAEEQKHYDTAEAQLRRAIELTPHRIGRRLDLAAFLSRHGRFDESEKLFEEAEQISPGAPRILFARAKTYIRSNRNLAEARDLLKRYLGECKLTPEDPPRSEALQLLSKVEGNQVQATK
jgi:tetratricopeptide (TPR) repeat protein